MKPEQGKELACYFGSTDMMRQSVNVEEPLRVMLSEEIGSIEEDEFDGSKEENGNFTNVFYETVADDARSALVVSRAEKLHIKDAESADHNVKPERMEVLSRGKLKLENKESRSSLPGTTSRRDCLNQSRVGPSTLMQSPPNVPLEETFRLVESFSRGILSSYHHFNCQEGIDGAGNISIDSVPYKSHINHRVCESGVAMGTFPSANLVMDVSAAPEETPVAVVCTTQAAGEHKILKVDAVDVELKKSFIRELPACLHSQAHRLLLDAGWKIEHRKRSDRTRIAFNFITPEGLSFHALSQAWRTCGERLRADASRSEDDEDGREWMDIDVFWGDLANALSYLKKMKQNQLRVSLPLVDQWQILDPFMAVVWINRRISALREGKAVRAVRSATFFLHDRKPRVLAHETIAQIEDHFPNPELCSHTLPDFGPEYKSRGACNQQCIDKQNTSVKNIVRRIGKDLHDIKCSRSSNNNALSSQHKGRVQDRFTCPNMFANLRERMLTSVRDSNVSCNLNFSIQKGFNPLAQGNPTNTVDQGDSVTELDLTSALRQIPDSIKRPRKKFKKIRETDAPQVNKKGMRKEMNDGKSPDEFGASIADGIGNCVNILFGEEEENQMGFNSKMHGTKEK